MATQITIIDLIKTIRRHVVAFAAILGIVLVATVGIVLFLPNKYTTTVSILHEPSNGATGAKAQNISYLFGLEIGNMGAIDRDAITEYSYEDILKSSTFRHMLLQTEVQTGDGSYKGNLAGYLSLKEKGKEDANTLPTLSEDELPSTLKANYYSEKETKMMAGLKNHIKTRIDNRTSLFYISSTFEDNYVAAIVADAVVNGLQQYVLNYRAERAEWNPEMETSPTPPFCVIQPATVSYTKSAPHRSLIILLVEMMTFLCALAFYSYKDVSSDKK